MPSSFLLAARQGPKHGDFSAAREVCYTQHLALFSMPHIKLSYSHASLKQICRFMAEVGSCHTERLVLCFLYDWVCWYFHWM